MDQRELAEHIVKCLNEYFQIDPEAIRLLFANRVVVNEGLLNHPTVQCRVDGDQATMSILGLLNGVIGTIPGTEVGYLCGNYDNNDHSLLLGFSINPKSNFPPVETTPK